MFTHAGLLHLGGNMLFLWIFGNNVEDSMGPVRFVVFYLLGGIAALALQVAINPDSTVPTLGASGAIAGVLGGYIVIYPRARVLTLIFLIIFFTFIELPAYLFLFIWFAQQAIFGADRPDQPDAADGGGVAYFAHVGGLRLRPARRQAVREPPQRGLRPAEVPRATDARRDPGGGAASSSAALLALTVHAARARAASTSSPCSRRSSSRCSDSASSARSLHPPDR